MSMEESISLEETNKIRISLGLKPLTDDAAPADDKDKQAEDNYAKTREQAAQDKQAKCVTACVDSERVLNICSFLQGGPGADSKVSGFLSLVHAQPHFHVFSGARRPYKHNCSRHDCIG